LNQNAPSVDYPVGRFFWDAFWVIGLAMLSFLALIASLLAGLFDGWRAACLCGTWLLLTIYCVYSLKSKSSKTWLCWDGHEWQIQTPIDPHLHDGYAISVHLDFQQYLFVSLLNSTSRTQWFWVAKRTFPERWHGFRCAVYSSIE
jgi:hypothetical protein